MQTVSNDIGRKLKIAGLAWEPKRGDFYFKPTNEAIIYLCAKCRIVSSLSPLFSKLVWLPAISDIFLRLEEMGYRPGVHKTMGNEWLCALAKEVEKATDEWGDVVGEFNSFVNTPEDAAGLALIWALGQEKKGENEKC